MNLLTKKDLVERWGITTRTIDRLRADGKLPWIDVSAGEAKPSVRFKQEDVLAFEDRYRKVSSK